MFRSVPARVLLVLCSAALAFGKPNFSGEWKMNADKSDFGPLKAGAPKQITRSVHHSGENLEFKTVQSGVQGELVTQMKYTTDGKEAVNQLRNAEVKGTAKWNGEVLVIESRRVMQGTEISQSDQWSLTEGGKTMTVESSITTPQGAVQFRVLFEKQESGESKSK